MTTTLSGIAREYTGSPDELNDTLPVTVPFPPQLPKRERQSVEAALAQGPATFLDLMAATGTRDGRDVLRTLDKLYADGSLSRLNDGRYALNGKHG